MTTHKTITGVEVKNADEGTVEAVFATFGVKDDDGDVTLPGAFTDGAEVVISAYGHRSWSGELPVGKGTISEDGDRVVMRGRFFLDTAHGRDTFGTVKNLGGLQEWSYSLENVTSEQGTHNGEDVTFLKSITVKEVSPVLRGAGVGTRTLAAKAAQQPFAEHARSVLADVDVLVDRAEEIVTLRAAKGKTIGIDSADLLAIVKSQLDRLAVAIQEPAEPTIPAVDLGAELARAVALIHGVEQ